MNIQSDVLIIHPLKHHLINFTVGARCSGKVVVYVTPFYRKGLGTIVAMLPGSIGAKASGYWNSQLPPSQVISPLMWQARKLITFLNNSDLTAKFDAWAANQIRCGIWQAHMVVTVQDYLPQTTEAAKAAGCIIVSDQISNQSSKAMARIERHYRSCGLSVPIHDETINKRQLEMADHITVPSRYTLEGLSDSINSNSRVHLAPYGVNVSRFVRLEGSNERRLIRIVARANTVRKGGHLLLKAINAVAQDLVRLARGALVEFVFLGEFENSLIVLAQEISFSLPSEIRIVAKNFAHAHVPTLLAEASLFVMPSLSESMSLAALEAASSGLPMILSRYCGIDRFVEGIHGILADDEVESVADGLLSAFSKSGDWAEWGRNTRTLAEAYSWESYEKKIGEIIKYAK